MGGEKEAENTPTGRPSDVAAWGRRDKGDPRRKEIEGGGGIGAKQLLEGDRNKLGQAVVDEKNRILGPGAGCMIGLGCSEKAGRDGGGGGTGVQTA